MREDMHKVIVERPRLTKGRKHRYWTARNFRNRVYGDEDGGFAPHHLGMKAGHGYGHWLNENLSPLERWLHRQVDRPCNKVTRELRSGMDDRNEVQAHILTHVEDFVAFDTRLVAERVYAWNYGRLVPSGEARQALFVHPRTRILLRNRERLRVLREAAEGRRKERAAEEERRKLLNDRQQ